MNSQRILMAVLVLLFVGSAGQYWLTQQALDASRLEITQLHARVERLDAEVEQLQGQVALLGKTTVQGIVREANSALLDGWSSVMSTVESELVKARESMNSAPAAQLGSAVQPAAFPVPGASTQP